MSATELGILILLCALGVVVFLGAIQAWSALRAVRPRQRRNGQDGGECAPPQKR